MPRSARWRRNGPSASDCVVTEPPMPEVRLFPLAGAARRDAAVQQWFSEPGAATRRIASAWFDVWRTCGPDVEELLHDGHPTVCVQGIALGYVNAFSEHANVGFFLGATLPAPAGLLEGSGRFMRHVKVRSSSPDNGDAIRALMYAAYADLKARLAARPASAAPGRPA